MSGLRTPFAAFVRWSEDGNTADADKLDRWSRDLALAQAVLDAADEWEESQEGYTAHAVTNELIAAVRARRETQP